SESDFAYLSRKYIIDNDLVVIDGLWNFSIINIGRFCSNIDKAYVIIPRGQLLPWAIDNRRLKKQLFFHLFAKNFLRQSIAIQCTDQNEVNALKKLGFNIPTFVVPNSIDITRFEILPPRDYLRQKLGIPQDARVLLFLGR